MLVFHLQVVFGAIPGFDRAYIAVDFFFMLSGFIMAAIYEPRFAAGMGAFQFVLIRARRLWFPMAVGATLGAAALLLKGYPAGVAALSWGALLVFMPMPISVSYFLANGPAWSIFFELLANAAHPSALRRLPVRWLLAVSAVAMSTLIILCLGQSLDVGWRADYFAAGFPRVALSYCIGIALFRLGWAIRAPITIAAALLLGPMILFPENLLLDIIFVVMLCPLILLIGAGASCGQIGSFLGKLSFPLYAVHFPVLELTKLAGGGSIIATFAAVAVALLVVLATTLGSARQPEIVGP